VKGSAFACVNEGPGPVLCIPIDHHSEGLEVCCVDGRATTVASRHLTIWSTKCPSGATPSAIANGEDAEVLSFVRDGCLVNDATQTSNACIARCFDLLMSASSCRRMLNGGGAIQSSSLAQLRLRAGVQGRVSLSASGEFNQNGPKKAQKGASILYPI